MLIWVLIKLMLWPAGRLMGRPELTPVRSWRLMRGAVAGFIGAALVFLAPMLLMLAGLLSLARLAADPLAATAVRTYGGQLWLVAAQALCATVYAARVEAPADVFD